MVTDTWVQGTRAEDQAAFRTGTAPFQRELRFQGRDGPHSCAFPGILAPVGTPSMDEFLSGAAQLVTQPPNASGDESFLRKQLTAAGGAIQFKNTPLRSAEDFSKFMHVLGKGARWTHHVDKGLMVLRRPFAENVATANEGPPDMEIGSHNEYGLSSHFPAYIAFFCVSEADEGGATPIASSFELRERLEDTPGLLDTITQEGVTFSIHHPRSNIQGNLQWNSVFAANAFGPADGDVSTATEEEKRGAVEANVAALAAEGGWRPGLNATEPVWKRRGFSAHWQEDGSMIVKQRVPGVRPHPIFGIATYFNNIHNRIHYAELYEAQKAAADERATLQQLRPEISTEDGDVPFPQEWTEAIKRTTAELQVDVTWNKGDVLLLDNLAVQHGRRTWTGDRRLLASLWDVA